MRRFRIHPQPSTTNRHSAVDTSSRQADARGFTSAPTSRHETFATTPTDASSFTVDAPDGIRLSAKRIGPLSAPASVVYVHGMLTNSAYWRPLTEHLHQRLDGGIAQITFDQRGHGGSEHTGRGARSTLPTLVNDLDAIVAQARGAVVLVSHSVASLLVQAWVEQYPERARALAGIVMFNGCPEFPWIPASDVHDTGRRSRRRRSQLVEELVSYLHEPPARYGLPRRSVFANLGCDANLDAALAAYSSVGLSSEIASILRFIPTWVLTGELDPVVAPRRSRHLAEHIWGDYDSVAGAGHSLPHTHPAAASEPILAALEVAYRTHQQDGGSL